MNRRIGTFTLGFSLIGVGVAALVGFFTDIDIAMLLRFSPVVLIGLGAEIIICAIVKRDKVKYDGLSIFFCILVIASASAAGVLVPAVKYHAEAQTYRIEAENEKRAELKAVVQRTGAVKSADISMNSRNNYYGYSIYAKETLFSHIYIELLPVESEEEYVEECRRWLRALDATGLSDDYLILNAKRGEHNHFEIAGYLWQLAQLDTDGLKSVISDSYE